ncbi:MAG: site-specific DNA-methyltransferase [Planctomycetes bacterium]|jgi:site-specific DNA-methyltransferase (adenine-specific)|nr:site-specific DNA-methyltransferase [Planctomycetota bacterium]
MPTTTTHLPVLPKTNFRETCIGRNARLLNADAFEVLKEIREESVDLIFADPPYNLSNDGFTCQAGRAVSVNKGKWDKSQGVAKDFEFHMAWLEACRRVLKPNGTIWVSGTYHSIYACGFAMQLLGYHILNDICWFKPNASPNLSCRFFTASHETLIWARKSKAGKHLFNYEAMRQGTFRGDFLKKAGKQMRSVWAILTPAKAEKTFGKHPTQKSLALLDRVVRASSDESSIVLDPFMGGGTTGVAAVALGRRFIGIERERTFFELAEKRILAAASPSKGSLFANELSARHMHEEE